MGMNISSNFDLFAQLPLDSRLVVADLATRDAIPDVQRYQGMVVFVVSEQKNYQLIEGIGNHQWVDITTRYITLSGGTNIFTGGTSTFPVINLEEDISLNSVSANTIYVQQLYLGGTLINEDNILLSGDTIDGGQF